MEAMRLSKSRYMAGAQCVKQLWWRVHEPDAPELRPGEALQAIFDEGTRIGEAARKRFPGGVLVDRPHHATAERLADTEEALRSGAPAVFEASFFADDVFVAVDVLERVHGGFVLVEVKSGTKLKDEHVDDVSIQLHVLRRSGLDVGRAEVMFLNRQCRHPDLSNLFVRRGVTAQAEDRVERVPARVREMLGALAGQLPEVPVGDHCFKPWRCPFMARCWKAAPEHHVSTLYRMRRRAPTLEAQGFVTLHDLPRDLALSPVAARQVRAVQDGAVVVEPGLGAALDRFERPLACLDFETVQPPIPRWPGCRPYDGIPVQMSCHVEDAAGELAHHAWLAETGADPRPGIARALIAACAGARTILAYNAAFERQCVRHLIEAVPELASPLGEVDARILDLLPVVRDHVYHPAFAGRFSLKSVLPALVPSLAYDDLAVTGGALASMRWGRLLFDAESLAPEDRDRMRGELAAYGERDTLGMVHLVRRLRELASGGSGAQGRRSLANGGEAC